MEHRVPWSAALASVQDGPAPQHEVDDRHRLPEPFGDFVAETVHRRPGRRKGKPREVPICLGDRETQVLGQVAPGDRSDVRQGSEKWLWILHERGAQAVRADAVDGRSNV